MKALLLLSCKYDYHIQASGEQTATVTNVAPRVAQQGIITGAQVTAPTIVAMTTAVTATQLAAIGTSASSATVLVSV